MNDFHCVHMVWRVNGPVRSVEEWKVAERYGRGRGRTERYGVAKLFSYIHKVWCGKSWLGGAGTLRRGLNLFSYSPVLRNGADRRGSVCLGTVRSGEAWQTFFSHYIHRVGAWQGKEVGFWQGEESQSSNDKWRAGARYVGVSPVLACSGVAWINFFKQLE